MRQSQPLAKFSVRDYAHRLPKIPACFALLLVSCICCYNLCARWSLCAGGERASTASLCFARACAARPCFSTLPWSRRSRPDFMSTLMNLPEEYLIPTKVTAELPPGVVLVETTYPRGVMRAFRFSKTPVHVYETSFTVRMKLRVENGSAPLGHQKIALTIGYQACNQDACLPPTKLPATAELEIAAVDAPARPANANIFYPSQLKNTFDNSRSKNCLDRTGSWAGKGGLWVRQLKRGRFANCLPAVADGALNAIPDRGIVSQRERRPPREGGVRRVPVQAQALCRTAAGQRPGPRSRRALR